MKPRLNMRQHTSCADIKAEILFISWILGISVCRGI